MRISFLPFRWNGNGIDGSWVYGHTNDWELAQVYCRSKLAGIRRRISGLGISLCSNSMSGSSGAQ